MIDPLQLATIPGGFRLFTSTGDSVSCYGGHTTWPANIYFTPGNPTIADYYYVQDGQAQANGYNVGNTALVGEPYEVEEYWDDGMDCYYQPRQLQSSVPVDVNPTVTIGSFSQNPILINNTANVSVTVNPPANVTLTITSSGTGRATFGSSGNTSIQIPETTTVNVRGDAATSSGAPDLRLTASYSGNNLASADFGVTSGACNATATGHSGGGNKNCPAEVVLRDNYNITNYCDACQFTCDAINYDGTFTPGSCEAVIAGVAGSGNRGLASTLNGTFNATDCNFHTVQIRTRVVNAQGVPTEHTGGGIGLKCLFKPNGSPCS